MDIEEVGWGGIDLTGLPQDWESCLTLVNTVMNFWIPYKAMKNC